MKDLGIKWGQLLLCCMTALGFGLSLGPQAAGWAILTWSSVNILCVLFEGRKKL